MSSVRYSACILAVNARSKAVDEAVLGECGDPPSRVYRASWFKYCTLLVASAGAAVYTKVEGCGAVLVREGSAGWVSTVGRGNNPVLIKCWFTAASVALVIVSISS